jgi:hypothetical protein
MPLVSKKELIEHIINYTFQDGLEQELVGKYFEKIFGISENVMMEIFREKHRIILNNKDEICDYIDFNSLKEMIKKYVDENYK